MLKAADILCANKLLKVISLAENTVTSRVDEQLTSASKKFHRNSIAIDESTCRLNRAFCAVFIRGVDKQAHIVYIYIQHITEDLLDLILMNGTVTGQDVLLELEKCVDRTWLEWFKLVSIVTDGAPIM